MQLYLANTIKIILNNILIKSNGAAGALLLY